MTDATKRPDADTELIVADAALVRPYVGPLGDVDGETEPIETAPHEAPTVVLAAVRSASAPALPAAGTRQHAALAVRSSRALALTRHPSGHRAPRSPRGRRRGTLAVAATLAAAIVIGGGAVWLTRGGDSSRMPVTAAMPRIDIPSASASAPTSPPAAHNASRNAKPSTPGRTSPSALPSPSLPSPSQAPSAPPSVTLKLAPPNLAAGRSASDNGHALGHPAANAVDGDPNTYWQGSILGFPQSITVDLGATATISRMVLRLPPSSSWRTRTESFTVECGADAHGLKKIGGKVSSTFDPAQGNQATVMLPAKPCRVVQLKFSANSAWPAGQVSEIEIYSS